MKLNIKEYMQTEKNKKAFNNEGYGVPETYFADSKKEVMSKINKPKNSGLKIKHNNILIKALLMAASFLLLLTLIPNHEDEIRIEDLIGYVENTDIESWDVDIIIEAINLDDITDKNSEELINYLEDTDLETILETI